MLYVHVCVWQVHAYMRAHTHLHAHTWSKNSIILDLSKTHISYYQMNRSYLKEEEGTEADIGCRFYLLYNAVSVINVM